MSTINVQNLLVQINRKLETAKNNKEILMLSRAVSVLQTGVVFTVGTFANLPDPTENVGKLYFVEADALLYFSFITDFGSVSQWIPITNVSANVLWTWAVNNFGQLGDGTTVLKNSPGTVAGGGTNWCQVSGGACNTAAIKTDGTLWTWGNNTCGGLGDGTTLNRCSPGTIAGGGTNWCQVASNGARTTIAIKCDGTMWSWGYNIRGELGDGTQTPRCSPGTVAGGGTNWCQVSMKSRTASAIKTDGTLWTWGYNTQGRLGDGTTVSRCSPGTTAGCGTNWCLVSVGNPPVAAIKTDGTLWTWGSNNGGILGDGTTVSRCSPGTVWGSYTNWCQVSQEGNVSAIKTDGTLWTWGSGSCGILGDGTTLTRCSPGTVAGGGTNWCQVNVMNRHSAAIKTDGTLWTWGYNNCGQLGDGTLTFRCSPGTVAGGGTIWWKSFGSNCGTFVIQRETL